MDAERMRTAIELYDRMSELSEELYFATWLTGIESALWESRNDYPELIELSDRCSGWIVWIEPDGPQYGTFEPLLLPEFCDRSCEGPAWIPIDVWASSQT